MNDQPLRAEGRLAASSAPQAGSPRAGARPPNGVAGRSTPTGRRRSWFSRLVAICAAVFVLAGAAGGMVGYSAWQRFSNGLPDLDTLRHYQPRVMSRVYAGDGRLLSELATERRIFTPYAAIPDLVKRAFLAAEDQNFFSHGGVDPLAIMRAAFTDAMQYGQGKRPKGASTITQQVAKNMLLGNEISLSRKIREAILAIRIEESLSKERILELYLNEIYLGQGAYGVAAAAQTYFNKSLDELTLPEAAFIAALPKAPNNYNPTRFPDAARGRRDWVLDRMIETGAITPEQAAQAKAAPLVPSAFRRPDMVTGADYFAEEVRRQLVDRFGADQTTQGGLVVRTSLDPTLQAAADRVVHEGLVRYDQKHGGWRGAVTHVDGGVAPRTDWQTKLAMTPRPPGMLTNWRLGLVVETTDGEAHVGLLDHPGDPTQGRVLPLLLAESGWARRVNGDHFGPAPRRMTDIVTAGDVIMVEPRDATQASGKTPARPEHVMLRQIPLVQGALVSLDPATGRVLAMSGGWSFEQSQFNRATQANRQPGSSFKPFVYLTALEQGVSPSQRFLDAPFVMDMGSAGKWRPSNYEQDFNGPVPLRVALEKSLNLVTIRVANRVGMDAVAKTAIGFHEVDSMPHVLPAAIGAVETTVLREAGAYAGLDELGKEVVPTLIDSVQDHDGKVIWRAPGVDCDGCGGVGEPPQLVDYRSQIADPQSVFQLLGMMQGVVQRGTGYAAGAGLGRAIAGKTGTTQDFNDAWFAGFTPDLVTVVWVGFDTPASLGENETGGAIAAPIWHDFMAVALASRPKLSFVPPQGVTMASWDSGNGTVTDAFKPGQVPGASGPLGAGDGVGSSADTSDASGRPATSAAAVDSGLGGLY